MSLEKALECARCLNGPMLKNGLMMPVGREGVRNVRFVAVLAPWLVSDSFRHGAFHLATTMLSSLFPHTTDNKQCCGRALTVIGLAGHLFLWNFSSKDPSSGTWTEHSWYCCHGVLDPAVHPNQIYNLPLCSRIIERQGQRIFRYQILIHIYMLK